MMKRAKRFLSAIAFLLCSLLALTASARTLNDVFTEAIRATPDGKNLPDSEILRYSADIAAAVDGEDMPIEHGLQLVVVQQFESRWRYDVERCITTGDHGKSTTAFQLRNLTPKIRAKACASNRYAAAIAHARLSEVYHREGTARHAFQRYGGWRGWASKELNDRVALYDKLVEEASR